MKVNVSEFKAKCTRYIRQVETGREVIEITRNGATVAIVSSPPQTESKIQRGVYCRERS